MSEESDMSEIRCRRQAIIWQLAARNGPGTALGPFVSDIPSDVVSQNVS